MCWCTAFVVLCITFICECIALAVMVKIVAVWNVRCRKKKNRRSVFLVFLFLFQIQWSSMLMQRTFARRMACRHRLAEETFVTQGYIQNATSVWQKHELSRELSTALYITVWCDQPLARRAALNASAQVQIYLEDSQDFVSFLPHVISTRCSVPAMAYSAACPRLVSVL